MNQHNLLVKSDFKALPIMEKAKKVLKASEYIGSRYCDQYSIHLYLYNDYFVEIWYTPMNQIIFKIEIVEDKTILKSYFKHGERTGLA